MKTKVEFFGVLHEVAGTGTIQVSDAKNLESLNKILIAKFPGIERYTYRISVNRELVSGNKILKEGDEVALLPPFAGG